MSSMCRHIAQHSDEPHAEHEAGDPPPIERIHLPKARKATLASSFGAMFITVPMRMAIARMT